MPKPSRYHSVEFRSDREVRRKQLSLYARGAGRNKDQHYRSLVSSAEHAFRRRVVAERNWVASGRPLTPEERGLVNARLKVELERRAIRYAVRRMHYLSEAKRKAVYKIALRIAELSNDFYDATRPVDRHSTAAELAELDRVLHRHIGDYSASFWQHVKTFFRDVQEEYKKKGKQ